jgi:hypothetical protein
MKRSEKAVLAVFAVSLAFFVASSVLYFFGFGLRTAWWHLQNPGPILWHGLSITVPEGLVAEEKESGVLHLYELGSPGEVGIYFFEREEAVEGGVLESRYASFNFEVLEKRRARVLGGEAHWIRARSKGGAGLYREDIYPLGLPLRIAFLGEESRRGEFERVVEALERLPSGG